MSSNKTMFSPGTKAWIAMDGAPMRFAMRDLRQQKFIPLRTKLLQAIALLLWAPFGVAQNNLGELLDAGAKKLSAEEFKQELIGRTMAGATPGGSLEVIYIDNGVIRGAGFASMLGGATGGGQTYTIEGSWKIDDGEKVCTSMQIGRVFLPPRCQFWFKYDQQYYISDSDSDRNVRVIRRTVKR
jgi:hypothetical protein